MKISIKTHFWILIGLSVILMIINNQFYINSFISVPQFEYFDEYESVRKFILGEASRGLYFYAFFLIDFLWAPTLVFLVYRYIKAEAIKGNYRKPIVFLIVGIAALLLDYAENIIYLFFESATFLKGVAKFKMTAYGIAALVFIFHLFEQKIFAKAEVIKRFLKTSYLSLLLLVIVVAMLTVLPQGSTIIVDLFFRPINLFFVFVLMGFLSLILSHYPAYFEARIKDKDQDICWKMDWHFLGFGIVYFEDNSTTPYENAWLLRLLRHHLGTLVFIAFIYLMLFVAKKYFDPQISTSAAIVFLVGAVYFYYQLSKRLTSDDISRKWYRISLSVSIILIAASVSLAAITNWNFWTWAVTFIAIVSLMVTYLVFRLTRNVTLLSEDIRFIKTIAIFGWATLLVLLIANINPVYASDHLSPLNILLLYLINLYGLIVILFKHFQYYSDTDDACGSEPKKGYEIIKYLIPLAAIGIVVWAVFAGTLESDLHLLQQGKGNKDLITVPKFAESLPDTRNNGEHFQSYYHVASYGGGLKAALWNLLVLNKLQAASSGEFLRSTVSISANSGGTSGTGMYGPLWTYQDGLISSKPDSLWPRILEIGQFNHLSIDLTYLFGKDLVRELMPFIPYKGSDRSYVAAQQYAGFMGMPEGYDTLAFRQLWTELYEKNGHYPAFISQTISTDGIQGNSFSLLVKDNYNEVFPGARSVLDHPDCNGEITYFGALSTSNRFPIFSPAARIKGKGYFLDGGYFDNSGISSLTSFENYLSRDSLYEDLERTPRVVVINNAKGDYIKYVVSEWMNKCKKETSADQLSSIMQTLVSLDKVPNYLEEKLNIIYSEENVFRIHLPVKIDYEDIKGTLKGKPQDIVMLMEMIEDNNARIDSVLQVSEYQEKWGYVEPPLARLNSKPAVYYQKAIIDHHPHIQQQVAEIVGKL